MAAPPESTCWPGWWPAAGSRCCPASCGRPRPRGSVTRAMPSRWRPGSSTGSSRTTRPWLVVLDDLRDAADLGGLWPSGPAGRLLITAASPAAVSSEHRVLALPVPPFSTREAMGYLSGRLGTDPDQRSGAIDLVGDLGCEPIALGQASAVIVSSGMSCRDYRQHFTAAAEAARGGGPGRAVSRRGHLDVLGRVRRAPVAGREHQVAGDAGRDARRARDTRRRVHHGGGQRVPHRGRRPAGRPAADLERDPQPQAGGTADRRPARRTARGPDQPGDPGGYPRGRARRPLRPGRPGRRGRAARGVAAG